jgi:hypothetical protein
MPRDREQRTFTDPESPVMRSGTTFVQAYIAQAAVPAEHQAFVATHASNLAPDPTHLPELLGEIEANGPTAYVAPVRITHDAWRNRRAPRGRIPTSPTRRKRMKRRLSSKAGNAK